MTNGKCLAVIVVLAGLTGCHNVTISDGHMFDFSGEQAVRSEAGALPDAIEGISVDNRFGTVSVEPAELGDEGWAWDLTTWANSKDEAEALTQQIEMTVQEEGGIVRWKLELPESSRSSGLRGVKSNITLRVPPTVSVDIDNRGDVIARELAGQVKIENRHGDIALVGLSGKYDVSNQHGEVAAANLGSGKLSNRHGALTAENTTGHLDVDCEHGDATISQVNGNLKVHNRHGKIKAQDISGDVIADCQHNNIEVTHAAGDVVLRNQHGRISAEHVAGMIDVENSHGQIDLRVESSVVKCNGSHCRMKLYLNNPAIESVDATTSHGSIDLSLSTDLPISVGATADHGNVKSEFPTVGNGDSPVKLRASHGDIQVRRITSVDSNR